MKDLVGLAALLALAPSACHHVPPSYGIHPETPEPMPPRASVGAFAERSEEANPALRRFAEVHVTTLGAWAAQGEGTLFRDGETWLDLMLFSTLPGSYVLRLAPNCLGQTDAPAMCASEGADFVSNVNVDPHGNATLRVALPNLPHLAGHGLVLYRIVTDATQMPGQPSCVATACGLVEPVP